MSLDPEIAKARRADSLDAAAALLEDFDHMRALLVGKTPNRADARHLSVILRRWLIEGDLPSIANPRIGRLLIQAADLSDVYLKCAMQKPVSFYAMDVSLVAGAAVYVISGNDTYNFKTGETQLFPVEKFRDQNVVYFEGTWINRRELVRYVANEKSGVHSGQEEKIQNKFLISRLEMTMSIKGNGNMKEIKFEDPPVFAPRSTYRKDSLNPVLIYMYLSASDIIQSPDMVRLTNFIRQEIA